MRKKLLFIMIFALIFASFSVCYACFVPSIIPFLFNFEGQIAITQNKWILFAFFACLNVLLGFLLIKNSKQNAQTSKFSYFLAISLTLEEFIIICALATKSNFAVGDKLSVPLSLIFFFVPSSVFLVWSKFAKFMPFKSPFGIKNKYSLETEFLWKQYHIFAGEKAFAISLLMLLTSFIFCIFNLVYIELAIFVALIVLFVILVQRNGKTIYFKYKQMEEKRNLLKNR